METLRFSSNIKCDGCIAKVTPHLNATVGEQNWEVDLTTPNKILTVAGDVTEAQVKEAVQKAGYKIEKLA
ncbi:MAG: heavy-metal-associated domain-containing protein [Bacteroidota bacterium]